ncbi:MAG: hypothetical protein WB763_16630 [Terriglobia bacterium]
MRVSRGRQSQYACQDGWQAAVSSRRESIVSLFNYAALAVIF